MMERLGLAEDPERMADILSLIWTAPESCRRKNFWRC